MNESNNKSGYTQVDHYVFDYVLPTLSPSAQLVFLRIFRQTVGWHRESDRISLSQFKRMTGYRSHHTVESAVAELEGRNLVVCVRKLRSTTEYSINFSTINVIGDREGAMANSA